MSNEVTTVEVEPEIDAREVNLGFRSTNPNHRMTVTSVPVADLKNYTIDPSIQRNLQDTEVENIYRKFNPAALGVLTISRREDGVQSVLDGQQRRTVLLRLHSEGRYDGPVQVMVHEGLLIPEEARLFLDLNARRAVDAIRRFKTRLVAEDPQALHIMEIFRDLGITISSRGVQAIETVDRIYAQENGPERVRWALRVIRDVYDSSRRGGCYDGRAISAFSLFHAAFYPILDEGRFIDRLSEVGDRISKLRGAGRIRQDLNRGNAAYNMAEVMRTWYNESKRRTNKKPAKLPEFPRKTLESLLDYGKESAAKNAA